MRVIQIGVEVHVHIQELSLLVTKNESTSQHLKHYYPDAVLYCYMKVIVYPSSFPVISPRPHSTSDASILRDFPCINDRSNV